MKNVSRYAKCDPAFMSDGLFVPKADPKKATNIEHKWGNGVIRFRGVQLGAVHQSVLLAVCARTGRNGLKLVGTPDDLRGRQLRLGLTPSQDEIISLSSGEELSELSFSKLEATAYSLLIDSGMGTAKKDYDRLMKALADLSSMVVYRAVGRKGGVQRLLSFSHDGDAVHLSLNWRLAEAIFNKDYHNILVSLHERMSLKSPVAKILHAWLCAHINLGRSLMEGQGSMIDTLCGHVWGEDQKKQSKQVAANRRKRVREALKDINGLTGWAVEMRGQKALISRPKDLPRLDGEVGTPGQTAELIHFNEQPFTEE